MPVSENIEKSCMFLLFGATGDLAKRKLIPGLFQLYKKGILKHMPIICIGRKKLTLKEFKNILEIKKFIKTKDKKTLNRFLKLINYISLDFNNPNLEKFKKEINLIGKDFCCAHNKIFYLALPSGAFKKTTSIINNSKIINKKGWNRVVYEKPFGRDLKSAHTLNNNIHKVFNENEIYRIDHYLAKELVQNIFTFRFTNSIFFEIWNNRIIDNVQIIVHETLGVEKRAVYYDKTGALRDMIQNHFMQILSLVAMEAPKSFDADNIRDQKVKIIKNIKRPKKNDIVIAQYTKSITKGKVILGYTDEDRINKESKTETFVAAKLYINTPRWKGVPFYLRTGKRLNKKFAEVNIILKNVNGSLFPKNKRSQNLIKFRIQPDEGIAVSFNIKSPNSKFLIQPVNMNFCYPCRFGPDTPKAYDHLLREIILGNQSLFTRWDCVAANWKLIDYIRLLKIPLRKYKAGSFGPKEADELIKKDNREWIKDF